MGAGESSSLRALRALAAACFFLLSPAAGAGLIEDMAAFERVYIPALALTNQPQQPAPRVAASLERLARAWPRMREAFSGKGAALGRAVQATDRGIAGAQRLLAAGQRAEAHEALEAIRPAYIEARRVAGIEFYLDRLVEFHDVMEEVVKLANNGASAAEVRERAEQASGLWRLAEHPRFDAALFGFNDAKYGQLRSRAAQEREIIDRLLAALLMNDMPGATVLAKEMRTLFSQIYTMFGDFSGL